MILRINWLKIILKENNKVRFLGILLFFLSANMTAQQRKISGHITDSLNSPLPTANILAVPENKDINVSFSVSDEDGSFKLLIDKSSNYTLKVSFLGFHPVAIPIKAANTNLELEIKLKKAEKELGEVIVVDQPVVIKEDTIVYAVDAFKTGEERKLKHVLKKLPGVQVTDKGQVTVKGKKVTTMLVEGKPFFNGGTKLAIDNIPANAINQVEVIDNYSSIPFMKGLESSNELAMNIKLKKDKKQFVFGDVKAGYGNNDSYIGHANLFYYHPDKTANLIANSNNAGKSLFTLEDFINFEGGALSVLDKMKNNGELMKQKLSYFEEDKNYKKFDHQFLGLNLSKSSSAKTRVEGYFIFTNTNTNSLTKTNTSYRFSDMSYNEILEAEKNVKSKLGTGRLKIDYTPRKNEQITLETYADFGLNDLEQNTNINSDFYNTNLIDFNQNPLFNLRQSVYWNKRISKKHTLKLETNFQSFNIDKTQSWQANNDIFHELVGLSNDSVYNLEQKIKSNNNTLDILFKHYYVIGNLTHLYTSVGFSYKNNNYNSSLSQLSGEVKNKIDGFNNNFRFELYDLYAGLSFKQKVKKHIFQTGFIAHNYNWKNPENTEKFLSKYDVLPEFSAEFKFKRAKEVKIDYAIKSSFPEAQKFTENYVLNTYSSLIKGNQSLENELYHSAKAIFSQFRLSKSFSYFFILAYSNKIKGLINDIEVNTSDYVMSPILLNSPEYNWGLSGFFDKKIYKISFKEEINAKLSNYTQKINGVENKGTLKSLSTNSSISTNFKNFPNIKLNYQWEVSYLNTSETETKFIQQSPGISVDYDFGNQFVFNAEYKLHIESNHTTKTTNTYNTSTFNLSYQIKDKPWAFEIEGINIFNNETKNSHSVSNFYTQENATYILPSIFLLSVNYKL